MTLSLTHTQILLLVILLLREVKAPLLPFPLLHQRWLPCLTGTQLLAVYPTDYEA